MGPLKKPKNTKCKDGCFELLLLSGDGTIKETKNKETKCKDGCFELLFLSGDGTLKETKNQIKSKAVVLNAIVSFILSESDIMNYRQFKK